MLFWDSKSSVTDYTCNKKKIYKNKHDILSPYALNCNWCKQVISLQQPIVDKHVLALSPIWFASQKVLTCPLQQQLLLYGKKNNGVGG